MKKEDKDVVVRFSRDNHKRLKALISHFSKDQDRPATMNDVMNRVLDTVYQVIEGEMKYVVGQTVYDDVAEARGEAIMQAVKDKEMPQWPKVIVVLGEDKGS